MEGTLTFRARLEPGGPSFMPMTIAIVPLEIVEALGGKSVRRVMGTLNGHPFRLGLQPMRTGERYLMISKELRQASGVEMGQEITLTLAPDPDPDHIELPEELAEGLDAWPEADAGFQKLRPSMKRAIAQHVGGAKRTETRLERSMQILKQLATGGHPFRKPADEG
ncbi:YdeI/OmpD-associated family protein [Hymenobacter jejuensis]|uniref:DUF1905 domain-containing protein n=1 Tax=Hymenobacter jejuensis TaxID=2502781 RepID=A0A5B8A349_9BACT|nr:YdeI/OmpD-associated family protein [Hymenobacter jejuensis]QDA60572.1 DUF1905 domain-containing protein [Hymenobacter jejuensis]